MWGLQELVHMNNEAAKRARTQRAAARRGPAKPAATSRPEPTLPDFVFKNPYDKVFVLEPQNEKARRFLRDLPGDDTVFWTGNVAVVRHGEVDATAEWLTAQGFEVL